MTRKVTVLVCVAAVALIATIAASHFVIGGRLPADAEISIGKNDLGGVVTSSKGIEPSVWVIAETNDLPTGYRKIVVTDDKGRYLVPDLPKANYNVWVRGYGLVDSAKVQAAPGKSLNLTAVLAPDARAAAQYYPSDYWYSLLKIPDKGEFPGTGPNGNGISEHIKSQAEWIGDMKTTACEGCHQLGDKATREIPKQLGKLKPSEAWPRRLLSGQNGQTMLSLAGSLGQRALENFADWSDRIAEGELPPVPPRPQGLEQNAVITEWDWGTPQIYLHDAISTDKRNPTINANGLIYGPTEVSSDYVLTLDPVKNEASKLTLTTRDPNTPFSSPQTLAQPWMYWGNEIIWNGRTSPHSSMFDKQGRVWTTSIIRSPRNPSFCKQGSSLPSAKFFPLGESGRQLDMYDPKTKKTTLIDTCFGTHHLDFDRDDTLWFSNAGAGGSEGAGEVVGWFNTKTYDETHDEQKAQGWTPFILDTNGDGRQGPFTEPDQPIDPNKDRRIRVGFYSVIPDPIDGSIWGTVLSFPGAIVRLNLGANPPMTTLAEIYEPPWNNSKAPVHGYSPRGIDIDRNGIIWTNLSGSGHLARFDRRKCKGPLNGPTATGQHCPEGWTLFKIPGPEFKGLKENGYANAIYLDWVDQFDTLGLGNDVPIATGNGSDSLEALLPNSGKVVTLRVPYPMGFYAKGLDGRIDDPKAGWKGRGVWSTYSTRAPWHIEGGKGQTSKVVKFQIRPNPLAN